MKTKILAALTAGLMAGPALAHVTLEQGEAPAGARYKAVLQLGHGCDGQATTALRVRLPDGFYAAKPMPKPGWTLQTVTGAYARPFDNHGETETSGVREIVWSGGELPDDWYDEFTLTGRIGPEVAPGSTLYFPTVQECGKARQSWIDVTGSGEAAFPAPGLEISDAAPAPEHHHHGAPAAEGQGAGHGHDHAAAMPVVQAGELAISDAFARATPPKAQVAGGFLTITSQGAADRLLSAESPVADKVEIHEMRMDGDVMTMRPLPDGLAVSGGGTVALQPGGAHLMLTGLKKPLVEGDSVPLVLEFEKAGRVNVTLEVMAINARGAAGGEHAH